MARAIPVPRHTSETLMRLAPSMVERRQLIINSSNNYSISINICHLSSNVQYLYDLPIKAAGKRIYTAKLKIGDEGKMGELLAMEMYLGAKGGGSNHHEMRIA